MKIIKQINQELQNERGLGLVETIAALGIAILVITSLVSLSVFTLRASSKSKLLLQGSKAATQQLELIRAFRDGSPNWESFIQELIDNSCTASSSSSTYTARCYMSLNPTLQVLSVPNPRNDNNCSAGSYTSPGVSTPKLMCWSFEAVDNENQGSPAVEVSDSVIRLRIEVIWRVGSEINSSYIYSDISNWRHN